MGILGLLAMMSALMFGASSLSDSDDNAAADVPDTPEDEPDRGNLLDDEETPSEEEEPIEEDVPVDDPQEPDPMIDTGATFLRTEDGVEIELGEDETRSLAVINFTDTQDDPDDFILRDEARFYLVPEELNLSAIEWVDRDEIPGFEAFGGFEDDYNLPAFEKQLGLELIGMVDLKGVPDAEGPNGRVGEIVSNVPFETFKVGAETDGDYLWDFSPENPVITHQGASETETATDATGTEGPDWFTTQTDGIALEGAAGNDLLLNDNADVTLSGGDGNDILDNTGDNAILDGGDGADTITSWLDDGQHAVIDAGTGDDEVKANYASVNLGLGDDSANASFATVFGGDGNDTISAFESDVYGGEGDDTLELKRGSVGFGGAGADTFELDKDATGFGGEGDDTFVVNRNGSAFGGDGDDTIIVRKLVNDTFGGTSTAAGGAGADTFTVKAIAPKDGVPEDPFLRITDFDILEDSLEVGPHMVQTDRAVEVESIDILEADDGSHTDVRVNFTDPALDAPGSAIIRLDGVTGLTQENIAVLPNELAPRLLG